jgi:LEA14-like dessication related protein
MTRSRVLLVTATVLVTACIPRLEQPDVWLDGVRLASLGLSGGVVDVRLSVYNPNRFALEASGLTYDLDLEDPDREGEWLDFTEGLLERPVQVGANDTVEIVIPVEFTYRGLGSAMRGLLERGSFDYRLSGAVSLERPLQRAIRYRHRGAVSPGGVK